MDAGGRHYFMLTSVLHLGVRRANFSPLRSLVNHGLVDFARITRGQPRSFSSTSKVSADVIEEKIFPTEKIRNIAIIAHGAYLPLHASVKLSFICFAVDHGKTTLVDQLLRQSGTVKQLTESEQAQFALLSTATTTADSSIENGFITRVMDSNALERERGITILSKCTSINYQGNLINIVDTPGHADFGGEVERVLSMVDGVALVVDATEGPMTQTRFVLSKALSRGLRFVLPSWSYNILIWPARPLVVLNKSDRPTARPAQVESDLFDLFATLGATDEQVEYPLLYASAKQGWAADSPPKLTENSSFTSPDLQQNSPGMTPLFDLIMSHVPPPVHLDRMQPFSMLTVQIEGDPYVGTLYLGRVQTGVLRVGDLLWALDSNGNKVGDGKVKKIFGRQGLERVEKDVAGAGEIISIAGIKNGGVNVTLVHPEGWGDQGPQALPVGDEQLFHNYSIDQGKNSRRPLILPQFQFSCMLMTRPLLVKKGRN